MSAPHDQAQLPELGPSYRVLGELGRGGMATVYLAEDVRHERRVAVKVFRAEVSASINAEWFAREIAIAARLNHPHIVPLFDSGVADGVRYYVMPFITGESLRDRLRREKVLDIEESLRLTRQIASALSHAHAHGVIHRDVKPENILLSEGLALVADFGIAYAAGHHHEREPGNAPSPADPTRVTLEIAYTGAGLVVGTPDYMAPEQISATAPVDGRCDLYALGCVLYEMLSGRPPFLGDTPVAVLAQHLEAAATPVIQARREVPPSVSAVIERAMAKDPADRYATAARFGEAIVHATMVPLSAVSREGAPGRHNLPRQRTRFIGRTHELAECSDLLGNHGLVTITGPGGAGKTRLALQAAEAMRAAYPGGVWFVDLGPVTNGDRVRETVGSVLTAAGTAHPDSIDGVIALLRERRCLLLLDNCEHLLDGVIPLVEAIVRADVPVTVLATSRERLNLPGEAVLPLGPLALPGADVHASPDALLELDAVQLFLDRARLAQPGFAHSSESVRQVAEICRRLDGIPLAIELAAARAHVLSLEDIRARLDDRFRLLTRGNRAIPRHETLQAAVQWSYDALSAEEQACFRRISVFAGGWVLEAAAAVAGSGVDEFQTLDMLARLVDKSLVVVRRGEGGETRYALLETFREFGRARLREAGEETEGQTRHLEYRVAWLEAIRDPSGTWPPSAKWLASVRSEHENILAVLAAPLESPNAREARMRVAARAANYWRLSGLSGLARTILSSILKESADLIGDDEYVDIGLNLADACLAQGDGAAARAAALCAVESVERMRESFPDQERLARLDGLSLQVLGRTLVACGDRAGAREAYERGIAVMEESGQTHHSAYALNNLAVVEAMEGRRSEAARLWEKASEYLRGHSDYVLQFVMAYNRAEIAIQDGDRNAAHGAFCEALMHAMAGGVHVYAPELFDIAGALAHADLDPRRATRYYGVAAGTRAVSGKRREPDNEAVHAPVVERLRASLGPLVFGEESAEGGEMGIEDALRDAAEWVRMREDEENA